MQTIRSVQRSVDGGVDSNILQRNISIIEAVQIQLVRIETLFSDPINSNYAVYLFLAIYVAA